MYLTLDPAPGSSATKTAEDAVRVRPVDGSDAGDLVTLHRRLSPRTLRCRFLTPHPDLSAERIAQLTEVDGHDRVAVVAVVGGHLAGFARYQRRGETDDAIVTLVVDDGVQGRDVEVLLLQRLVTIAHREGFRRLLVRVSPIDRALIERLDDSPFDVSRHYHAGIVTITLRLDPFA